MEDKKRGEVYGEEEILVTDAQPAKMEDNGPPIPPGHHRFYCEKCHTVSA